MPPKKQIIKTVAAWLGTGSINIFGMQFSGKDTQGLVLAQLLDGIFLSSGDILRNSTVPEGTKEALRVGNLVPPEDFVDIVVPYLSHQQFSQRPLILSSVGRWIGEEQSVLTATKQADHPIKAAILLHINEDLALQRLKTAHRQRDDDYKDNVLQRIKEFKAKTIPVLEVYRDLGLLVEVDGRPDPETVTIDILQLLYERAVREMNS